MKLNLGERITTLSILPKESSFATLKIARDLQGVLAPSEEEIKEFEVSQEGQQIKWNAKGVEEKEIEIGEKATDLVVEALKELDTQKKLTARHLTLWAKFIEN